MNSLQLETMGRYQRDVLMREAEQERLARSVRTTRVETNRTPALAKARPWTVSRVWRPRLLGQAS